MTGRRFAEERAICRAILHGPEAAEAAFEAHRVSELERAWYQAMAEEALDNAVRRRSPFRRYAATPIRNPIRITILLAGGLVLAAGTVALLLLPQISLSDPARFPILTAMVSLSAVVAAALGWGVSSWVAHRTARAKQTLDIVSARFSQPAFGTALADFNVGFLGRQITADLVARYAVSSDPCERAALQGLRYLVNYFEFISVGVLMGELDEAIVRRTLRGNLRYVYDRCAAYIVEVQRDNPRTLENFTALRMYYREL